MAGKIQKVVREVNGITVEQRSVDGFINGTAMCVAHDKKINAWFRNQDTLDLFVALALDLDPNFNCENSRNLDISRLSASNYTKIFVGLVISKSGSPETGGGTWLHPDLAVQLAQWCSKPFALQVSRWVREWMTSAHNPIQLEADADRVKEKELLRDYFPITDLANYASLCQAAANEMAANGTSPLKAIDIAAKQILSPSYVAKPIDFTERISLVRRRLEQKDQIPLLPED